MKEDSEKIIEDISAFERCITQTTGGVTGSFQVQGIHNHKLYQLKPSILDNKTLRRLKANDCDRENFGEFIAASIARALITNGGPNVSLVYDKQRKRISIVSEYLESQQQNGVRNLDDYAREIGLNIPKGQHVQFIKGTASDVDKQSGKLSLDDAPSLNKKNFSETLALSAILGDHDINPGNMMVVTDQDKTRIVRIDFGHAFNDLLNAPEFLNGGLIDKENPIMDYFNREKIPGIGLKAQSKVWRDYPGMVLTTELANALCDLGERAENVGEAIQQSQAAFLALVKTMVKNQDKDGSEHVMKSLIAIVNNANDTQFVKINSNIRDNIPLIFDNLKQFIIKNCENAKYVGQVMGLQLAIDEQIKTPGSMSTILNSVSSNFSLSTVLKNNQPIQWVKTAPNLPPFVGSLKEYVISRKINYLEQKTLKTPTEKLTLFIYKTIKDYDAGKIPSKNTGNENTFELKQIAMHVRLNNAILCLDNDDLVGAKEAVDDLNLFLAKTFGKKKFLNKDSTAYLLAQQIKSRLDELSNDESSEARKEQIEPNSNPSPHSAASIIHSFKNALSKNRAEETPEESTLKPQSGG